MPNYNYTCKKCDHTHTEFRSMNDREAKSNCDKCGALAQQTLSAPALHLFQGDSFAREHEIEGNGVRSYE